MLPSLLMTAFACGPGVTLELVPGGGGEDGSATGDPGDAATWTEDDGASASAPPCSSSQRFGMPSLVSGLPVGSYAARLSPDERTAYLGQDRGGQVDILVTTRPSRSEPFGAPVLVTPLNSPYEDNYPTVTADGLTLYLVSQRSGQYELYESSRARTSAAFAAPALLSALTVNGEGAPFVIPDGTALYFHSWRDGDPDLYRAVRTGGATTFGTPERLAVVSTSAIEYGPVVSPDELTIYFQSTENPAGQDGAWTASRSSISESFGDPVYLSELNGNYRPPSPSWISPDGCRLYFGAINDVTGSWVYMAERAP